MRSGSAAGARRASSFSWTRPAASGIHRKASGVGGERTAAGGTLPEGLRAARVAACGRMLTLVLDRPSSHRAERGFIIAGQRRQAARFQTGARAWRVTPAGADVQHQPEDPGSRVFHRRSRPSSRISASHDMQRTPARLRSGIATCCACRCGCPLRRARRDRGADRNRGRRPDTSTAARKAT